MAVRLRRPGAWRGTSWRRGNPQRVDAGPERLPPSPGMHTPELRPRYVDVVVGRPAARDLGPDEGIGVHAVEPNTELRA